jgi:hypothetical protein
LKGGGEAGIEREPQGGRLKDRKEDNKDRKRKRKLKKESNM